MGQLLAPFDEFLPTDSILLCSNILGYPSGQDMDLIIDPDVPSLGSEVPQYARSC
jgi:hypothetical protein